MKAIDTNILLRFVVQDDEVQLAKATQFLANRTPQDPAFVSLIVLVEFMWTLQRRYEYSRADVRDVMQHLLESAELTFEDEDALAILLAEADRGDLADHLIAYSAARAGCSSVATFDRDAARDIPSMELLS